MYKKLATFVGILTSISLSTERATLVCSFEAIAVGYESSSYTQKLLVTNTGNDGYLYNFRYPTGECYSGCSTNKDIFQIVENPDKNAGIIRGYFSYNHMLYWSTTHGNVSCIIKRGWYSDVKKVDVPDFHPVQDTIIESLQNKSIQESMNRNEELNTIGRNVVFALVTIGIIALLISLRH